MHKGQKSKNFTSRKHMILWLMCLLANKSLDLKKTYTKSIDNIKTTTLYLLVKYYYILMEKEWTSNIKRGKKK